MGACASCHMPTAWLLLLSACLQTVRPHPSAAASSPSPADYGPWPEGPRGCDHVGAQQQTWVLQFLALTPQARLQASDFVLMLVKAQL